GGRHPGALALGDAAGADPLHVRNGAGLAAVLAGDAADVEDEVVEVAVVAVRRDVGLATRAATPARRAGGQVLEGDVVGVRIGDRVIDERRDPRLAGLGVVVGELGLPVLRLRALAGGRGDEHG